MIVLISMFISLVFLSHAYYPELKVPESKVVKKWGNKINGLKMKRKKY